jgi:hypothetical protein
MKVSYVSLSTGLFVGAAILMASVAVMSAAAGVQDSVNPPPVRSVQDEIAAPPDKRSMENLMRQKLVAAKTALEGISRHDHGMVQESAARMIELSRLEAWERMASPRFVQDTADFIAAAEFLNRVAESRDADGEELGFLRVMMTCTNCHRHVRGAAVAGGAGVVGDRSLAGVIGW